MKNVLLFIISIFFISCVDNNNQIDEGFFKKKVLLLFNKMDKRECSLYSDTVSYNKTIKCVSYIDEKGCSKCQISQLSLYEKENMDKEEYSQIEFVYIVKTNREEIESSYRKICDARIRGTVYLDTCNAFLSANPQIPDNELYHTFVINKEGKVLMVGNPFQSEKMEELFKKVIAKERKKQKKNANKAV